MHKYAYTKQFSGVPSTPGAQAANNNSVGNYNSKQRVGRVTVKRYHGNSLPAHASFEERRKAASRLTIEYVKSVDSSFNITDKTFNANEAKEFCIADADKVLAANKNDIPKWEY